MAKHQEVINIMFENFEKHFNIPLELYVYDLPVSYGLLQPLKVNKLTMKRLLLKLWFTYLHWSTNQVEFLLLNSIYSGSVVIGHLRFLFICWWSTIVS